MDIEDLKTFLVLSNTKNFTRTAQQMFIAQSTVTNRINELEKQVGRNLLYRTNRSVELTAEGERFRDYAEKVVELTESSLTEIASYHRFDNVLRIGAADSIYEAHLATTILKHKKNHPKDALKISFGMSYHLIEQLQNDYFDVVFSYLPLNKLNYQCEIFKEDQIVLVTDYCNAKYEEGITKEELHSHNYLMCNYALGDVGQFVRDLFPGYHQFSLEIDDCAKIIPFLLEQDNYTFLPSEVAAPYVKDRMLRIIPFKDASTPVINSYIIGKKEKVMLAKKMLFEGN